MKRVIELTEEEYSTVYTAVRLEHERLYGDQDVEPLLRAALEQLKNFRVER